MPAPARTVARPLVAALLAGVAAAAAGCRNGPPGGADRGPTFAHPANAPAFASSAVAPDEGTVKPVAQAPKAPLRIAVLGLESSQFWIPVKTGLARANKELQGRATVEWIVPGDVHTADVFGRAIDAAVAKQYDAIVTIAGDAGAAAYINRAVQSGIPVATFNSETDTPNQRLFFVGADSYAQGKAAGTLMCKLVGPNGKVGLITGFFSVEAHAARVKGFEDALKAGCPNATVVGRVENRDKADVAYQQAKDFMTAHSDLGGIIAIAGSPFGAARAIDEAGKGGKVHMISFDAVDETMDYVDKGVIDATIGQDPDAQGHDPAVRLYNYIVAGQLPPAGRLATRADVITKANAAKYRIPRT
ncbi:ABC transporter substrate-binding protein [Gemmatimonadetes bacterium T265]|nr:ABC transporter substrate-binding protein [Gemmatimonadetes bacterium T265]